MVWISRLLPVKILPAADGMRARPIALEHGSMLGDCPEPLINCDSQRGIDTVRVNCSRRLGLSLAAVNLSVIMCASGAVSFGQEQPREAYPDHVARYLNRLYDRQQQPLRYRADYAGGFPKWQDDVRTHLRHQLGLARISKSVGNHKVNVELGDEEDLGEYVRQRCEIETEPDVRVPFWLLKPKGSGPWPLGVFPHGHDRRGHLTSAGVYEDEAHRRKSLDGDRDVAVQAVRRGFLAIAPAVRGLSIDGVPDMRDRHGARACRSHVMHCFLAGRTAMGERVWDMQRILDWALNRSDVDPQRVLMMGNSGGGMITLFTAATDERVHVAVPSCSFAPTVSSSGYIYHCDCNMVPGLIDVGGLTGVAGMIAPRHLLAVNGRSDRLFDNSAVERAIVETGTVFEAAGTADHFQHRWGHAGHRFYADLMWPFVLKSLAMKDNGQS